MSDCTLLYGRSVLREEIPFTLSEETIGAIKVTPAFQVIKGKTLCRRCGTVSNVSKPYPCICGESCLYCRECIALGKVRACALLYSLDEPNRFEKHSYPCLKWEGRLSQQQSEASDTIIKSIDADKELIVWAVAGAGKTEMLFKGIEKALDDNKRVCIASPRVDVCLELAPRIRQAFPAISLAVLYGGAEDSYAYTQLVVATTHQLYRFEQAFDVLIIDEVDAFPYHMNAGLLYAAEKSRKRESALIYLTATPDKGMQKRIKKGRIEAVILPARYHGYALPVPKAVYQKQDLFSKPSSQTTRLIRHMTQLIQKKQRFLLFVPTIALMEKVEPVFQTIFSEAAFSCVHSKDEKRKEKVLEMRQKELDFLITTTILERGVTFENIDVLIWRADHPVYTEAALVQISGRAGRSRDYPAGNVTFYHQGWTRGMKKAVRQIVSMNNQARLKGLIQ